MSLQRNCHCHSICVWWQAGISRPCLSARGCFLSPPSKHSNSTNVSTSNTTFFVWSVEENEKEALFSQQRQMLKYVITSMCGCGLCGIVERQLFFPSFRVTAEKGKEAKGGRGQSKRVRTNEMHSRSICPSSFSLLTHPSFLFSTSPDISIVRLHHSNSTVRNQLNLESSTKQIVYFTTQFRFYLGRLLATPFRGASYSRKLVQEQDAPPQPVENHHDLAWNIINEVSGSTVLRHCFRDRTGTDRCGHHRRSNQEQDRQHCPLPTLHPPCRAAIHCHAGRCSVLHLAQVHWHLS